MQRNHAVAAVVTPADGDNLRDDIHQQGVESAETGGVANDVVGELLEVFFWSAGEDQGREDGLEAVDVGGGETRVDKGGLEVDDFAGGGGDGLQLGVVAGVAEGGGGVDGGGDLGGCEHAIEGIGVYYRGDIHR